MCGRYYVPLDDDIEEIRRIINELNKKYSESSSMEQLTRGEIFPNEVAPIIARSRKGNPGAFLMQWGFHRPDGKGLVINARSETAPERSMFRLPLQSRRCLIPAAHYFEWERKGAEKTKYALGDPAGKIIYMAGIYRYEQDQPFPRFVILTQAALNNIAFIHDRMPVILPKTQQQLWLSEGGNIAEILNAAEHSITYREV